MSLHEESRIRFDLLLSPLRYLAGGSLPALVSTIVLSLSLSAAPGSAAAQGVSVARGASHGFTEGRRISGRGFVGFRRGPHVGGRSLPGAFRFRGGHAFGGGHGFRRSHPFAGRHGLRGGRHHPSGGFGSRGIHGFGRRFAPAFGAPFARHPRFLGGHPYGGFGGLRIRGAFRFSGAFGFGGFGPAHPFGGVGFGYLPRGHPHGSIRGRHGGRFLSGAGAYQDGRIPHRASRPSSLRGTRRAPSAGTRARVSGAGERSVIPGSGVRGRRAVPSGIGAVRRERPGVSRARPSVRGRRGDLYRAPTPRSMRARSPRARQSRPAPGYGQRPLRERGARRRGEIRSRDLRPPVRTPVRFERAAPGSTRGARVRRPPRPPRFDFD